MKKGIVALFFCDDPILPDIETGAPLEDALSWILSK